MEETQHIEKKSLRVTQGGRESWKELAKDCVGIANAKGGILIIGIEDNEELPPSEQKVDNTLASKILTNIKERCYNVSLDIVTESAINGGQYIKLTVLNSREGVASTSDGKYYLRVGNKCNPVLPNVLSRLFTDKSSIKWETLVSNTPIERADPDKQNRFLAQIRKSDRVNDHVKSLSDERILEHLFLASDGYLTNLGVLWLGKPFDRGRLHVSPTVRFFKHDENSTKVSTHNWEDHALNPLEMIESIWTDIPDWKEGIEIYAGLFKSFIPHYDQAVVRELLVNAFAHRPYTIRGEIFIDLYPDRLEIRNPGLLPLGITPENVLHKFDRRNEELAKIFYYLNLMDREGSGIDKIYQLQLANSKSAPEVVENEEDNYVKVIIYRHIIKEGVIPMMQYASQNYQLTTCEVICLGLIAQNSIISASELSRKIGLFDKQTELTHWLGKLIQYKLVLQSGRTKGTKYQINPMLKSGSSIGSPFQPKPIESQKVRELVYKHIRSHDTSSLGEITNQLGDTVPLYKVKYVLKQLLLEGMIKVKGTRRWARYSIE